MSEQEATLPNPTPKPKNKGGRPRKNQISHVAKQVKKAMKEKSAPLPTVAQFHAEVELASVGPWIGEFRWVTIMPDPTKQRYQLLSLGDLPIMRVRRGMKVCIPIELFNNLVDTAVPVLKTDIETTSDPYHIERWEEIEISHKYQDHGPATLAEFQAFMSDQRKLIDPFKRRL